MCAIATGSVLWTNEYESECQAGATWPLTPKGKTPNEMDLHVPLPETLVLESARVVLDVLKHGWGENCLSISRRHKF